MEWPSSGQFCQPRDHQVHIILPIFEGAYNLMMEFEHKSSVIFWGKVLPNFDIVGSQEHKTIWFLFFLYFHI